MSKQFSLLVGLGMVVLGLVALAGNLLAPALGFRVSYWLGGVWWPLFVVGLGLVTILPAVLTFRNPGLGALYIPGIPVIVTGGILFFTNLTGLWGAWSYLWPFEVLALALGFLLAALQMRSPWMTLPAVLIGANGAVLQFCALTHQWDAWAVLWTVEPLALGLGFLLVGILNRSSVLAVLGALFCGFAGTAMLGMSLLLGTFRLSFSMGWLMGLLGPALFILLGVGLVAWGLVGRSLSPAPTPAAEAEA